MSRVPSSLPPRAQALLYDVATAATHIVEFTRDKTYEDFETDVLLRSAVERQFEIVGEAVAQLGRIDAELVGRITGAPRIIAFRNILIHGYAAIRTNVVWDTVQSDLDQLRAEVAALLAAD